MPDGVYEHFAAGIGKRGGEAGAVDGALRGVPGQISRAGRPRSSRCSGASCPAGWDRDLPVFPADPKGIAGREHRARC